MTANLAASCKRFAPKGSSKHLRHRRFTPPVIGWWRRGECSKIRSATEREATWLAGRDEETDTTRQQEFFCVRCVGWTTYGYYHTLPYGTRPTLRRARGRGWGWTWTGTERSGQARLHLHRGLRGAFRTLTASQVKSSSYSPHKYKTAPL